MANTATLKEQLAEAQQARRELERLQRLSSEAPKLAAEVKANEERQQRAAKRAQLMGLAREEVNKIKEEQARLEPLLQAAAEVCFDLYKLLTAIRSHRDQAMQHLAATNYLDYQERLADSAEGSAQAYALASLFQNGDKRLFAELYGDQFSFWRGIDVSSPVKRDLAEFIEARVQPRQIIEKLPRGV